MLCVCEACQDISLEVKVYVQRRYSALMLLYGCVPLDTGLIDDSMFHGFC